MPTKHHIRPRDARFIGVGNVAVDKHGHHLGWQLKCSRCGQLSKPISSSKGRLPPEMITKKLAKWGWFVGNKPSGDICDVCQRKPVESHLDLAKKALTVAAAPMVANGVHYDELLTLALQLEPEQAKQLIKAVQEKLPHKQYKPKKIEQPVETDEEYRQWLEEQG